MVLKLYSMHQNHLEGFLKHRLLGPTRRVSDSIGRGGGVGPENLHFHELPGAAGAVPSSGTALWAAVTRLGVGSPSASSSCVPEAAEGWPDGPGWCKRRCFPKGASEIKCRGRVLCPGPWRACVLLFGLLGAESSQLWLCTEGPVLYPKTTWWRRIQFGRGTFCWSILSLNLITHARAFQTFGCKFLEIQLIFSDIFILEHLEGDGSWEVERETVRWRVVN